MKLGTFYLLPDGRKGLYVGEATLNRYAFTCQYGGCGNYYIDICKPEDGPFEEYREPRVFEDEVLVVSENSGEPYTIFSRELERDHRIHARRKITLEEGEGL